jgi:hypothetical protein
MVKCDNKPGITILARIGAMKITLGWGGVIGGSSDLFPNQSLEVKDIHICDHSAFGHETTSLGRAVRLKEPRKG